MSSPRVYVISDTHFGHRKIIEFEKGARPYDTIEEHDRDLIERWNQTVRSEDTVWHLGDVYFGKNGLEAVKALKGYKRLVLGNHDRNNYDVLRQYFNRIYGCAEYGGCILTHIPVHPYQLVKRYDMNIHGHMHSKRVMTDDGYEDDRYECVSVEHTDLKPVLLQQVIQNGI